MSETSGFFISQGGDRRYTPAWLAEYIKALVTTGVYADELAVVAAEGMAVTLSAGRAWLEGYMYHNDAPLTLTIDNADTSLGRKDSVVIRLDLTARTIHAMVLKGSFNAEPTAPAPTRTADVWDLKVAEIDIPAGTASIDQAKIKDTRLDETACGVTVCTVQHIPTDTFLAGMTAEFDAWFESVKGILGEDEAGRLLQMIQEQGTQIEQNKTAADKDIAQLKEAIKISNGTKTDLGLDTGATLDQVVAAAGKHIVLDITFAAASYVNKSYTITGAGLTKQVTGTVPSGKKIQVPVLKTNCEYTLVCNGTTVKMNTGEYFGIYEFFVAPPLSSATPEMIGEVAASGLAPKVWKIGDEVNITLTDQETITLQIYDFNHDTLTAGGTAHITFGMKNCMKDTKPMENSNINTNGWSGSVMYSYLNTTVYGKLPTGWKSIIKKAKKLTSAGNQSATIKSSDDYLFLFSEEELFGKVTYAKAGEGKQYPIFTDNNSRIKKLANGTGSATRWWERSPYGSNATGFCYVNSDGTAYFSGASSTYGVAFGFCV